MRVRYDLSRKQPVRVSAYLSMFSEETLAQLKAMKPFTTYHKDLKEYEVTPEVLSSLKEPITYVERYTEPVQKFERKCEGKYGYQQDAVSFSMQSDNVMLNFPQGMGKSFTTMRILAVREMKRTLIVCGQMNLQEEWLKDARKHEMLEALSMAIVGDDSGAGNKKKLEWLSKRGEADGTDLINIEALRNEDIVNAINDRKYTCIVVDEVQSAKGWKSEQTIGLHSIIRTPGQMRIALSGTPVLNDPLEFFSLFKFFGVLKDTARTTFEKYYGEWGFDFWGHYVCKGYRNLADMRDLIDPILCYAKKEELNLPYKSRTKIDLPMQSNTEYANLRRVYKLSASRLKKAGYSTKPEVRAKMQYLSSTSDLKVEFVANKAKSTKVLAFSNWTTVLEYYKQQLELKGIKVLFYHGGLSMKQRLKVLSDWSTGEYEVLLLSTMAARYGLNLTEADTVIFIDIPTSISILEQAEDRSHRIGQTNEVKSYLLCGSEIDEEALENIARKQYELDRLYDLIRT